MNEKHITTPITKEKVKDLKAGDRVYLSGEIYTARDAAHKRLVDLIENGEVLPFDIKDATIYYVGPSPAKPGQIIGSAGPTTSYRMDAYSPLLIQAGQTAMIGKGERSKDVVNSMIEHTAVYFAATGGAAALISKCIKGSEIVAYEDLGPEAVRKLTIENFPLVVAQDCYGGNLYEDAKNYAI